MNRATIRQAIKNGVEDQTIDDSVLNQWIQDADNAIQAWRPEEVGLKMTFDYWDYLKDVKRYCIEACQYRFRLPDNYRAFVELTIGEDKTPYRKVDYSMRNKYDGHICWILGKYLYIKENELEAGENADLIYVKTSDEFASDADEPEIESIYHTAHVCYGKARYYNQIAENTEEKRNMDEFNSWMIRKKNDQEITRMQENPNEVGISMSTLV